MTEIYANECLTFTSHCEGRTHLQMRTQSLVRAQRACWQRGADPPAPPPTPPGTRPPAAHAPTAVQAALAAQAAARGFDGFFLDTLDSIWESDRAAGIELLRQLRAAYPEPKIVANRGFDLLSDLQEIVDGVCLSGADQRRWNRDWSYL